MLSSSLHRQQERLFKRFGDPAQESGRIGSVNQAVIVGEREWQNQPRLELASIFFHDPLRLHARPRKSEDRDLGMIHDGRKTHAANAPEIGDGERAPFHIGGRQFFLACFLRELRQLDRQFDNVFLVDVANHRNQQAAVSIGGHADVDVLLVDDFFFVEVDAGVELRKNFQCRGADFQRDRGDGHFAAGFFGLRSKAGAQLFEFGNVGAVVLRDVRNRVPGFGQMLGGLAANSAHRDALDLAPLGEVGQLRLSKMSGARRGLGRGRSRGEQGLGVSLDVVFADASARACAFHFVNVNADFAGKSSHVGRGRNRLAIFGARNFAQLYGHGEYRCDRLRLIRRQRLFFRFAFGANGGLKREAGSVLPGNVFDGSVADALRFGLRGGSAFEREDYLSNFDLLAFFYFDFFNDAADRRRHFDHSLVGLEFHHRLAFGNFGAGRDHQANQIALGDVFSEFGEFEFAGAGGDLNRRRRAGHYWRRQRRR